MSRLRFQNPIVVACGLYASTVDCHREHISGAVAAPATPDAETSDRTKSNPFVTSDVERHDVVTCYQHRLPRPTTPSRRRHTIELGREEST